jgi:ribonuclease J
MGAASKRILNAAAQFMPAGRQFTIGGISYNLENEMPFTLGPFTITPYLVDHSAYDAYALLIEADGEKLLYTGDIRMHGKKGILTERLSENLAGDVDVLLMEGTNLFPSSEGHQENSTSGLFRSKIESEKDVENELVKEFSSTSGFVMLSSSSQNIDRIVSVYRACKRSGRFMIIDLYTAAVLASTGNENIPQSGWDGVKLFIPFSQRVHIKKTKLFDILNAHSANRIYMNTLRRVAHKSVMLARPVHLPDLAELAKVDEGKKSPLDGGRFIYSQWAGYLHKTSFDTFRRFLDEHQIPITLVHTSGHAFLEHLQKFAKTLNPGKIVPIHTSSPENFSKYFDNVELHPDGEFF